MTQPIDNNPLRVVVDNSVTDSTEDYRRLEDLDLNSSAYYENRELSYLKFNFRVLEQAKIIIIHYSNVLPSFLYLPPIWTSSTKFEFPVLRNNWNLDVKVRVPMENTQNKP